MTDPDNTQPAAPEAPKFASPADLAKLTANAVAAGQNAAAELRTLGGAVVEIAETFRRSCETEAVAIEQATEKYSAGAERFAMTVFAQGTAVSTIRDAVSEIQPRPRVEERPVEADRYGGRGGTGDIARDLDVQERPLPKYLRQGPRR